MLIRSCAAGRCCRLAVHGDGGVRRLLLFIREKDEQKVLENFFSILADLAKKARGKAKFSHVGIYRAFTGCFACTLRKFMRFFGRLAAKRAEKGGLPARQKNGREPDAAVCLSGEGGRVGDEIGGMLHVIGAVVVLLQRDPAGGEGGVIRALARLAGARPAPPVSR